MKTFLIVLALAAAVLAESEFVPQTEEVNPNDVPYDIPDLTKVGLWAYADQRIVGGWNAAAGQAPFQVSLRRNNRHFCGGSIINSRWVLSAAHCTWGSAGNSITVVVGTNRLTAGGIAHQSIRIVNHPQYNTQNHINDVSLIQVGSVISGSNLVASIALAGSNTGAGLTAQVTGWGQLGNPGNIPDNLQIINLRTLTNADCRNRLGSGAWPVLDSHICTLTQAGQGVCMGDSGGPLVVGGQVVGVVSWVIPCARGFPDVYARVWSYRSWILNTAV